ncbi:MAG: hypothetical protein QOK05_2112 [Chloroflexota bacterium]|jgi:hypothetical protein|nr:hypothetical protein [Chloroflexota bacterium]
MQVQIRFLDGEIMEGESDAATLQRMGFPVSFAGGNNQIAWVSLASIKYVLFKGGHFDEGAEEDPRNHQNLVKVVMHFVDGETMRSYKDDTFSQDGEGFNMRVYDPETKSLLRVLVSLHALKAIFFVNEWDSRTEEERMRFAQAEEIFAGEAKARAEGEEARRRSALHSEAAKQVQNLNGEG